MIFKNKIISDNLMYIHPILTMIIFDARFYCHKKNLDFIITEGLTTKKHDLKIKRRSATHREGRAFDIGVRGWSKRDALDFCKYLTKKFEKYGAIVGSTNEGFIKRSLCVYGDDDHLDHIHIQIDRKYKNYGV